MAVPQLPQLAGAHVRDRTPPEDWRTAEHPRLTDAFAEPTPAADAFYVRQMRRYRRHNGTSTPRGERARIRQCYYAPGDPLALRIVGYAYFVDKGRAWRTPLSRFIRAV